MAEFKYAKGRISESLQFILGELKEFQKDYASNSLQDYRDDPKLQKLMDRTAENILTALIEVCGTVLTQENISAENYAQVLGECAKRLGFTQSEQEILSKLALQRNRLAHRYLNFRWEAVNMLKEQMPLVTALLNKISVRESKS